MAFDPDVGLMRRESEVDMKLKFLEVGDAA